MSWGDLGFGLVMLLVCMYVGGFVNAWYVVSALRHRGYDAHLVCAGLLPTWGVLDAALWKDPRFSEVLVQALASQGIAVALIWGAVTMALWSVLSMGALVLVSLCSLVSVPLYYVLERKVGR